METGQGHDRTPTSHAAPRAGKCPPDMFCPMAPAGPPSRPCSLGCRPQAKATSSWGRLGGAAAPREPALPCRVPQRDTCSSAGRAACCSLAGCPGPSPRSPACAAPSAPRQGLRDAISPPSRPCARSTPEGPAPRRLPWLMRRGGTRAQGAQARAGAPGPGSDTVEPPFWREPHPSSLGAPCELPPQAGLARVSPEPVRSGR